MPFTLDLSSNHRSKSAVKILLKLSQWKRWIGETEVKKQKIRLPKLNCKRTFLHKTKLFSLTFTFSWKRTLQFQHGGDTL